MEHTSEDVTIGKILSENSYQRRGHEIYIEDYIDKVGVLDFYDRKRKIIHEIKKSKSMEELHIWQVKYYIYLLEKNGINGVKGEIDYPKLKRAIKVDFTDDDRKRIDEIINDIKKILNLQNPPPVINKPYCKKCSYYEFCFS